MELIQFQPTCPVRGTTSQTMGSCSSINNFNPRAPYGARRGLGDLAPLVFFDFNPRAPYGARPAGCSCCGSTIRFQPTRPIRGATTILLKLPPPSTISTHAPHTGRDIRTARNVDKIPVISTHAPHTGRDCLYRADGSSQYHFNPRAPYGARPTVYPNSVSWSIFQPTRPIRGATFPVLI